MNYQKRKKLAENLSKLAKKEKLVIFTGPLKQLEEVAKEYDGTFAFISDGSPSARKIEKLIGEKMYFASSKVIVLKNRYNGKAK